MAAANTFAKGASSKASGDPQTAEARFLGPITGKTKVFAFTTSDSPTGDLTNNAGFEQIGVRDLNGFVAMIATQDVQFSFGDSAVTISANDPYIPAGTFFSCIATGRHLGLKGLTAGGNLYIWPAS